MDYDLDNIPENSDINQQGYKLSDHSSISEKSDNQDQINFCIEELFGTKYLKIKQCFNYERLSWYIMKILDKSEIKIMEKIKKKLQQSNINIEKHFLLENIKFSSFILIKKGDFDLKFRFSLKK